MHRHMNITHRDKWGISHKSTSKRGFAEPTFTHNPSGCVNPPFRSMKSLASNMYCHA
jgi:hypothetical protein